MLKKQGKVVQQNAHLLVLMPMHRLYAKYGLSEADVDRIVEMAWEDRTPFEAIAAQFGLPETEVVALMKLEMHPRNWQK